MTTKLYVHYFFLLIFFMEPFVPHCEVTGHQFENFVAQFVYVFVPIIESE